MCGVYTILYVSLMASSHAIKLGNTGTGTCHSTLALNAGKHYKNKHPGLNKQRTHLNGRK